MEIINTFITTLKSIFYTNFFKRKCLSRIERIDKKNQMIVVYTRGIYFPIYIKFTDLIKDKELLESFSSKHASFIGYYYGLSYLNLFDTDCKNDDWFNINSEDSKCNILYGIDRKGNVLYLDHSNQNINSSSPRKLMRDEQLISKFLPLQSCYIGILSGINDAKSIDKHNYKLIPIGK